jgi:alpha-galactosidase
MAEPHTSEIFASHVSREIRLDASKPAAEWQTAQPIRFSADWQGRNPDPELETEVRVLWSPRMLYLRFACNYRELFVFVNSDPNGRRDYLWDRDVAEAFLQPEPSPERYYKEFEIAPNGMWIDLNISPSGLAALKSGLSRSVHVDQEKHIWTAEMAIPVEAITKQFDPSSVWRVNFYRIEGAEEPRRYMAWLPTNTPQPNFHVPEAFGTMRFDAD